MRSGAGRSRAGLRPARVALLAAATFALLGFDLGALVFESNDEARFPLMARDVLANGHWLAPEIAGVPMLNKPPLHAWLIALSSLPTGAVTQRSAALPSALGGLAVVLATTWIGSRLFSAAEGMTAGVVAATTAGVFSLARIPLPDMSLTLAITVAMGLFGLAELEQRRHALTAFYGVTGLAFLTKGPVGLMPLAAALGFQILAHGPRGVARLVSVPGIALLALLTIPWPLLALHVARQQFVDDVLLKDMHANYFGLGDRQWRRLTEPIRQAVTVLLPWSLLAPVALWSAARESAPEKARPTWLVLAWAAAAFCLTAVSMRQRLRYYLPLCPPMALLIAVWWRGLRWPQWAGVAGPICVALTVAGLVLSERSEVTRRGGLSDLGPVAS